MKAMSMVKQQLNKSTQKIMKIANPRLNSTKYVIGKGETQKSNHIILNDKPKERQRKFISLLSSSLIKELSPKKKQFSTIQPQRYSPQKKTEKIIEKIKFMLPSISSGRKTIAF